MKYVRRTGRAQPPAARPNSAEAWCALLQRASVGRVETVEIPEGATDAETLRAWRSAAVRAAEHRASRAGR